MATLSDAWGDYEFDFTKTNLNTPALRKAWLERLSDLLMFHIYDGQQPRPKGRGLQKPS